MLEAITDALTALVGDHGLYAVFALMLIDAILPAASELVMVYAGAVAAGAFAGQDVVLFGREIESEFWAYVAMAMAGGTGYVVGSILGWGSASTAADRSSSAAGAGSTSRRIGSTAPTAGSTATATGLSPSAG